MSRENPKKILFVCTGNSCRSVMAEAFFKQMNQGRSNLEIFSAGIGPEIGSAASPETISLLQKNGINVSYHRARALTTEMVQKADLIFVMQKSHLKWIITKLPSAKNKTFLLADFHPEFKNEEIGIPDPIGMGDIFYENVGELIKKCCEQIYYLVIRPTVEESNTKRHSRVATREFSL